MKIEVGMYCFNKTNRKLGIGKVISLQKNNNVNVKYKNDIELVSIGNIEASHNIIDLIEVGDYVNRKHVNRIEKNYIVVNEIWTGREILKNENIKSIVTKEQFESISYKVEEVR